MMIEENEERKARLGMLGKNGGFLKKPSHKGCDGGSDMTFLNHPEWRKAEYLSGNVSASARGLAKLGTYMVNKGTMNGKTIMTEDAWNKFHANPLPLQDQMFGG